MSTLSLRQRALDLVCTGSAISDAAFAVGFTEAQVLSCVADLTLSGGVNQAQRIFDLAFAGHTAGEIAGWLNVPLSTVTSTLQNLNDGPSGEEIVLAPSGGGGGGVSSVTAGDTSIVIGGSGANPTVETGTLDVIASDHPPAASWSNNSKKITSLANGTASSDAAAFGQIPVADSTTSHIQPDAATGSAGSNGEWADSGHVHPASGLPKAGGLTGATAATRFVGATTSGAPASGTFLKGDFVIDQTGTIWICTTAGSPGTWGQPVGSTPAPSGPSGTAGANTGSAVTIGSPSSFNQWWGVMNAATVTVTMPTATAGALFQARFDQDATGGRTLAFAANPTFPTFPSATAALAAINALSAANAEIWITFVCVDGSTWQAFPTLPVKRSAVSIAYAATITPAITGPQDFVFIVGTLTGAITIAAPTGSPVDGQRIEFRFTQDGTGSRAVTWNSAFTTANTALITWPSEPSAANATWKELYEWNAGTSKWERLAMV